MRSTADTLSLSWLPPDQPNGVILDYEIKYHERVNRRPSADYSLYAPKTSVREEEDGKSGILKSKEASEGLVGPGEVEQLLLLHRCYRPASTEKPCR